MKPDSLDYDVIQDYDEEVERWQEHREEGMMSKHDKIVTSFQCDYQEGVDRLVLSLNINVPRNQRDTFQLLNEVKALWHDLRELRLPDETTSVARRALESFKASMEAELAKHDE